MGFIVGRPLVVSEIWFKLSVDFPTHPKVIDAGPDAGWLAVCAIAYCRKYLTDGLMPSSVVPTLSAVKKPMAVAAKLVEAGLWEARPNAFLVHDFLDWNPSRADVESKRVRWKDTKRTQRSVHDGQSVDEHETPHAHTDTPAPDARSASVSPSEDWGCSEGSVRETKPRSGAMGGSHTNIDGRAQRRHGEHASPASCAVGACVHASLHDDFTRKLSVTGGKGPDGRTLREFYTQEADAIASGGQAVGEDVFVFWRNRFAAWVGTISAKPSPRSSPPQAREPMIRHEPTWDEAVDSLLNRAGFTGFQRSWFQGATLVDDVLTVKGGPPYEYVRQHLAAILSEAHGRTLEIRSHKADVFAHVDEVASFLGDGRKASA